MFSHLCYFISLNELSKISANDYFISPNMSQNNLSEPGALSSFNHSNFANTLYDLGLIKLLLYFTFTENLFQTLGYGLQLHS